MRISKIALCHPDKPHQAKGLCKECYNKSWSEKNRPPNKKTDLSGEVFGKLKAISRAPCSIGGRKDHIYYLCRCDCGNEPVVSANNLLRGMSKSCGCSRKIRPYESLYNTFVHHSNRERPELPNTLTYVEFVNFTQHKECHYCGHAVVWVEHNTSGKGCHTRYNLDRKNNLLGYSIDNCVVCCKDCNYLKGNRFNYEQFLKIGNVIRTFR